MIKEGQVRITAGENNDKQTVFVVTHVGEEHVDFIDNTGKAYSGVNCKQTVEETSSVIVTYPTWQEAVLSEEFKTGKSNDKLLFLVYKRYSRYDTIPVMAFTDESAAEKYCQDNNCDFVSPVCFKE